METAGSGGSMDIADPGLVEVRFLDYLSGLKEVLTRGETTPEQAE